MRLSESKGFHSALNIKNKHRSAIYQEMRDAELVLRFFAFKDNWATFSGGIKRGMDAYMETNRDPPNRNLKKLSECFESTLAKVVAIFGDHAFQRWMPEKHDWRRHALAALFDAQMFGLQNFDIDNLTSHRVLIMRRFKELFVDADFRKSIDAATNTPALFKYRIQCMHDLAARAIG